MRSLILGVTSVLLTLAAPAALGAEELLMLIPGVPGEVTETGFSGWISVASFSASFSNSALDTADGVVAGTARCKALKVVKPLDSTSPLLSAAVFSGTAYPTVTLAARRTTGPSAFTFLQLVLSDAVVSSLTLAGDGTTSAQNEVLGFVYATMQVLYYAQDPSTGAVTLKSSTTVDCPGATRERHE